MAESASVTDIEESRAPKGKSPKKWHEYWQKELESYSKRIRKFQKQGFNVVKRYIDDNPESREQISDQRLNLFWTNITTMQSMMFGQVPKADVSREHNDPDDDIARVAALLFQRILEADTLPSGCDLPTVLHACLQDRLLPGLGIARVHYSFEKGKKLQPNPETLEIEEIEYVKSETCDPTYVHWSDFAWGWGRIWKEIPWLGYRNFMDKDEATARFGAKKADTLDYRQQSAKTSDEEKDGNPDEQDNAWKAEVWEFWHMAEKKVFWWSAGAELILDAKDDPLGLDNFWPSPKPLTANLTTNLFMPKADYAMAQSLYNEIDELEHRISIITDAVRVVGVYDASAAEIARMLKEGGENDMIPVQNWAMFAEKGGISGAVDWFPVQEVVATLETLIKVQAQTMEKLYEITGMSDLMRGANTDQYTSDGTNQLKAKFGSVRVQALQDEFARFASDLDGLKAEVVAKHFTPENIAKQSGARFIANADKDKVGPAIELMKDPEVKWRVNISPESIAMVDYAQLKSERTEFLMALATYIQSAQAAAKSMPGSLPLLLELMKWGMSGFKGAGYLEGIMDQAIEAALKAPPQNEDNGEQAKMQGAMELEKLKQQGDMQKTQMKSKADMQILQATFHTDMQTLQAQAAGKSEAERIKIMGDIQKIQADHAADMAVIEAKLDADLLVEEAQSAFAIAEEQTQHTNNMTEQAQGHADAMETSRRQNDGAE